MPLHVNRVFIPLESTHDVVINEALRCWNVRYYLAILQAGQLHVVFEVQHFTVAWDIDIFCTDFPTARRIARACPWNPRSHEQTI